MVGPGAEEEAAASASARVSTRGHTKAYADSRSARKRNETAIDRGAARRWEGPRPSTASRRADSRDLQRGSRSRTAAPQSSRAGRAVSPRSRGSAAADRPVDRGGGGNSSCRGAPALPAPLPSPALRAAYRDAPRRAARLQWGDIDYQGRFIEVRRSLVDGGRVELPKNGKIRRVDLSPDARGHAAPTPGSPGRGGARQGLEGRPGVGLCGRGQAPDLEVKLRAARLPQGAREGRAPADPLPRSPTHFASRLLQNGSQSST